MSIASEITSIGENLKKDYQAIANLGANLTNVDKNIENIAELLDGVYDNLPKTEYQEGTEVTLSNTLKGKLDFDNGVVGIGQSSQESTNGYNIMNFNVTQDSRVTWNSDGTITINGRGGFAISMQSITLLANETYKEGLQVVSGSITSGDINGAFMSFNATGGIWLTTAGLITYTPTENITKVGVWANENVTFNNLRVKIWGYKGTDVKPFEKYTGGQASPNPSYPQEIKYVRGWNILNQDKLEYGTISQSDGTTISPSGDVLYLDDYIPIKPSSYYTFRSNRANYLVRLFYYDRNKNYISTETKSGTFQTISTAYYLRVQCGVAVNDEFQLVEGNVNLPYLPYNTIEETIRGLNFFEAKMATDTSAGVTVTNNNDGTFTLNGTATGSTTFRLDQLSRNSQDNLKSYENGTYTLSMGNSKSGLGMAMMQIDTYRTFMYVGSGSSLVSRTLTNATGMFIYLDITSGTQFSNFVVKPMLVKGTYTEETLPNFEPYKTPKTYQFSLGDYVFHGIGNYKDTILCDLENEKVYKKSNTIRYTADELTWSHFSVTQGDLFRTTPIDTIKGTSGYSNYYICKTQSTKTDPCFYVNADNPLIDVIDNRYSDTTNFKNWCVANNVEWIVPRATPTLTEITGTLKDQIIAWCKAQSLDGTTIIEGNGDLPMIIKVRGLKGE